MGFASLYPSYALCACQLLTEARKPLLAPSELKARRGIKKALPFFPTIAMTSGESWIAAICSHFTAPLFLPNFVSMPLSLTVSVRSSGLNMSCGKAMRSVMTMAATKRPYEMLLMCGGQ